MPFNLIGWGASIRFGNQEFQPIAALAQGNSSARNRYRPGQNFNRVAIEPQQLILS